MSCGEYGDDDSLEIASALAALMPDCQDKNNALMFFKASLLIRNQAFEICHLKDTIEELLFIISSRNLTNKQKK
jgi:hypothetical protein